MKIHHALASRGKRPPIALAIGFFDGMHRGHQRLLRRLKQWCSAESTDTEAMGIMPAVLTFADHPLQYLRPADTPSLLSTREERVNLFATMGIAELYLLPFDATIANLTPEMFVRDFLLGALNLRAVFVGESFRFGVDRQGDTTRLRRLLAEAGRETITVAHASEDDQRISSTRIRKALANGDLDEVDLLLGYSYTLAGVVELGAGRGHDLGFPTANLRLDPQRLLPPDGVYTVEVFYEGAAYLGLLSIGSNPTFDGVVRVAEVWIQDFHQTIYGKYLTLRRLRRVRGQQRFSSIAALEAQMHADTTALHGLTISSSPLSPHIEP